MAAASGRLHRHGAAGTALADVARDAGIAPGNVYYYFRTKDELARAVVDSWCERIAAILEELNRIGDPWARLRAFLDRARGNRASYAALGCPIAGLNRDERLASASTAEARRAFDLQCEWMIKQFLLAGQGTADAKRHGQFLLAGLQGAFALGHAYRDEKRVVDVIAELERWLLGVREAGKHQVV